MAAVPPAGESAPGSVTLKPVADAYTNSGLPSSNFGTSTLLRVDNSPICISYLRFDVQGLSSPVRKATLRVFSNTAASSKGVDLRSVANNTWGETTLTHNNKPPTGASIVSHVGAFSAGQWISFDATQLVTGTGLVSMALTTTSPTSRGFQSREDIAHSPQLVVETADITLPAVTLIAPPDGSLTGDATPTLSGAAGDVVDDSTMVRVKIYSGTSLFGIPVEILTTTRSGGSWSMSASPALGDGTYTAQADQSDASGNIGLSAPHSFTVDTLAPAVSLAAPAQGASAPDMTPTFSGGAGTQSGDASMVTLNVYSGTSASGTPVESLAVTASGGSWSAESPQTLSEGTYTAQAEQLDAAGNRGVSSANTFTVDATAPDVSLINPANDSSTSDPTPTFSGNAGAATGDASTVSVDIYSGASVSGSPLRTLTAPRLGGTWSAELGAPLPDGVYTARAQQSDSAGNTGVSGANTFVVAAGPFDPPPLDTTPPTVSLVTPADGSSGNDTTPTFSGGAGTQSGDASTVTLNVYSGASASGTPVESLAVTASGGSWSAESPQTLSEGTYTAQAEQLDAAGNRGVSSANTFAVDTTAPSVELTEPASGTSTSDRTPTFRGGAGAASGDSSTITVDVYSGSSPSGFPLQSLSTIRSGNAWSVDATSALPLGTYTAQAEQLDAAGNRGVTSANTFTVSDPVVLAAGDIACDPTAPSFNGGVGTSTECRQKFTSDILVNASSADVLALGDNQYENATYDQFQQVFGPTWGRVKSRIHPTTGNHEYLTAGASGYFDYFNGIANSTGPAGDRTKGYYSFEIGRWHVIAINSNCSQIGGCGAGSPQEQWLRSDLAAHPNVCTLAYWHHPLFSSGTNGNNSFMAAIWQALYDARADIVLSGHDHLYERFGPQTAGGVADRVRGIREFVVGTGGKSLYGFQNVQPNSAVRANDTFGVLKLTLRDDRYDWEFLPEAGKSFTDSGSGICDGSFPDTTPPSTPSGLTATANGNSVDLAWTASTDNEGVAGYRIFRNGTQIANSSVLWYSDSAVQPSTSYSYYVEAYDADGNASSPSNTAAVTTPPPGQVLTFTPTDDAYVYLTNANTNYGASTTVQVDNSPVKNFLLKFSVTGVGTRPIVSAKVRLYAVDPSPAGGDFRRVADSTWSERTITWANAPAADTMILASLGKVVAGNWYEVDVTPLVTGDGVVSLRVTSNSTDGADYSSKEGTVGFAPQLVVTLG
jgi:hypothetical protein